MPTQSSSPWTALWSVGWSTCSCPQMKGLWEQRREPLEYTASRPYKVGIHTSLPTPPLLPCAFGPDVHLHNPPICINPHPQGDLGHHVFPHFQRGFFYLLKELEELYLEFLSYLHSLTTLSCCWLINNLVYSSQLARQRLEGKTILEIQITSLLFGLLYPVADLIKLWVDMPPWDRFVLRGTFHMTIRLIWQASRWRSIGFICETISRIRKSVTGHM